MKRFNFQVIYAFFFTLECFVRSILFEEGFKVSSKFRFNCEQEKINVDRGQTWLGRVLKARLLILTKIGLAVSPATKAQAKWPQL